MDVYEDPKEKQRLAKQLKQHPDFAASIGVPPQIMNRAQAYGQPHEVGACTFLAARLGCSSLFSFQVVLTRLVVALVLGGSCRERPCLLLPRLLLRRATVLPSSHRRHPPQLVLT